MHYLYFIIRTKKTYNCFKKIYIICIIYLLPLPINRIYCRKTFFCWIIIRYDFTRIF